MTWGWPPVQGRCGAEERPHASSLVPDERRGWQ